MNTLCNDMGHLCPLFSYLSLGKYAPPDSISSVTPGPSLLFALGFLASSTVSATHSLSLYCGEYYRMEAERLGTQFFWKLGASCAMLGSMLGFLSFDAGVKMPLCIDHFTCVSLVTQSCPTLCDPMDCSPPDSSVHGDSPGNNTRVSCHAHLQRIYPTQESNPGVPHCRWILYHLSHQEGQEYWSE